MQEVKTLQQNRSSDGPVSKIVRKIGSNPLLLAFLFNLTAFLLSIILFDIKYEVSDDYITDAVLSGAFGTGYDPQLLFGNVILGYFLVFLYKLIPVVSFYFILLISLSFISATVVLYLLFKKKTNTITVLIAVLFLVFFSDDLYILLQFTKVAAAAGIAGGLLILHGLWEVEKHRLRFILSGVLLMTVGSLIRFETIYIVAAFLVMAFVFYAVSFFGNAGKSSDSDQGKDASKKAAAGIGIRLSVCVLIIGFLFGLNFLGVWICGLDKSHEDFNRFHGIRCSVTDKPKPEFEDIEDEYSALGLDVVDYIMLCSWNFVDREVYPDDLVLKVADIHQKAVAEKGISFGTVLSNLINRQTLKIPAALAVYIIVALALALGKKRIYPVVVLAASLTLLIGFIYYGRTMYRVDWGVFFCAAACIMTGYTYNEEGKLAKLNKIIFGKKINTIGLYVAILIVLLLAFRVSQQLVTKYRLLNCSDEEYRTAFATTLEYSGVYVPDKVGFPSVSRKLTPNLVQLMENDTEHYYIVDFATGIQDFYYNYEPWIRPEQGLFEKYSYYGGCTMHHPGECSALMANGVDPENAFKSLSNDNIYLVDNWGYEVKLLYFRRYFCPEAEIGLAGEVDGYKIWKIIIPKTDEDTANP